MAHDRIINYYVKQAGGGFNEFYAGTSHMRGSGIGSVLAGLWRKIVFPALKTGASAVGKEALRAGSHVLSDTASGENVANSLKRHFTEAGNNLSTRLQNKMAGRGRPAKKRKVSAVPRRAAPIRKRKRNTRVSDIFKT